MEQMNKDEIRFNHPQKEIVFVYKGEDGLKETLQENKKIVEVPKERPSWFNNNLFAKKSTQ